MAVSVSSEWAFSGDFPSPAVDIAQLHFLMEGYLHITEEAVDHAPYGVYVSSSSGSGKRTAHSALVRRTSDSSIRGSWKRRWCVLSQTPDGVHLVYYKHQTSFANCEPPVGVVFMEGCQSLYTVPAHPKSNNTFSLSFPHRNLFFYTDTNDELKRWLEAFETTLDLHDAAAHSQLKGLPKQKAERKDLTGSARPQEQELVPCCHGTSKKAQKEVPSDIPDLGDVSAGSKVTVVSYRPLPEEEVEQNIAKEHSPSRPDSKPHAKSELDSEGGPIQFLGFRPLDV